MQTSQLERREFITLLGGAAAAWPLAARAQQAERLRRIGVLLGFPESDSEAKAWLTAFEEGLQSSGGPRVAIFVSIIVGPAMTTRVCAATPPSWWEERPICFLPPPLWPWLR